MKKLLKILCNWDKTDKRFHTNHPWHEGGYSYSTNGFCLLRVPGNYGENKEDDPFPSLDCFDFEAMKGDGVPLDINKFRKKAKKFMCNQCNPKSIRNPRRCRECDGEGWIEWNTDFNHYDHDCKSCDGEGVGPGLWMTKDCPECHGTRINDDYDAVWEFGSNFYRMTILGVLVHNLKKLRFFPDADVVENGLGFKFDGGDGAIMKIKR